MTQRSQSKLLQALQSAKEESNSSNILNNFTISDNSSKENVSRSYTSTCAGSVLSQIIQSNFKPEENEINNLKNEKSSLKERIFILSGQLTSEKSNHENAIRLKNEKIANLEHKILNMQQENVKLVEKLNTEVSFLKANVSAEKQKYNQLNFNKSNRDSSSFIEPVHCTKSSFGGFTSKRNFEENESVPLQKKAKLESRNLISKNVQCAPQVVTVDCQTSELTTTTNCNFVTSVQNVTENTEVQKKEPKSGYLSATKNCSQFIVGDDNIDFQMSTMLLICTDYIPPSECCVRSCFSKKFVESGNNFLRIFSLLLRNYSNASSPFSQEKQLVIEAQVYLKNQIKHLCNELKTRKGGLLGRVMQAVKAKGISRREVAVNPVYNCLYQHIYPIHEVIKKMQLLTGSYYRIITKLLQGDFVTYILSNIDRFYIDFGYIPSDKKWTKCSSFDNNYETTFLKDFFVLITALIEHWKPEDVSLLEEISEFSYKLLPLFGATPRLSVVLLKLLSLLVAHPDVFSICDGSCQQKPDCYLNNVIQMLISFKLERMEYIFKCQIIEQVKNLINSLAKSTYGWNTDRSCESNLLSLVGSLCLSLVNSVTEYGWNYQSLGAILNLQQILTTYSKLVPESVYSFHMNQSYFISFAYSIYFVDKFVHDHNHSQAVEKAIISLLNQINITN